MYVMYFSEGENTYCTNGILFQGQTWQMLPVQTHHECPSQDLKMAKKGQIQTKQVCHPTFHM